MHCLNVSTYPSICPADYSGCVETQKIYATGFIRCDLLQRLESGPSTSSGTAVAKYN